MTNSRAKGARGELDFIEFAGKNGFAGGERTVQHMGRPDDDGDVRIPIVDIPFNHEVKRQERIQLRKWMQQSISDAGTTQIPLVHTRQNHEEWLTCMRSSDFFALMNIIEMLVDQVGFEDYEPIIQSMFD